MQYAFRRIFPLVVLALGLGWMVIFRLGSDSVTGGSIPAPQTGFLAPNFTLETTEGRSISLSELRGHPVIINFWASWCPPCRAEMPAIQAVYNEYSGLIVILAINSTNQDILSNVQTFVADHDLTFPILLDTVGAVNRLFAVTSLPTTFFIGPDGIIQDIVIGGPMTEAGLRTRIGSLLEDLP